MKKIVMVGALIAIMLGVSGCSNKYDGLKKSPCASNLTEVIRV